MELEQGAEDVKVLDGEPADIFKVELIIFLSKVSCRVKKERGCQG